MPRIRRIREQREEFRESRREAAKEFWDTDHKFIDLLVRKKTPVPRAPTAETSADLPPAQNGLLRTAKAKRVIAGGTLITLLTTLISVLIDNGPAIARFFLRG